MKHKYNKELLNKNNDIVDKSNIKNVIKTIIRDYNPNTLGFLIIKDITLKELKKILKRNNIDLNTKLPLVITKNHVYLNIRKEGILKGNYHNLGEDLFINALYGIDSINTVFINKESIVVVVDVKDSHNNDIVIPIKLKENIINSTIEANIIQSIYGKKNLKAYLRTKTVLYNKKW